MLDPLDDFEKKEETGLSVKEFSTTLYDFAVKTLEYDPYKEDALYSKNIQPMNEISFENFSFSRSAVYQIKVPRALNDDWSLRLRGLQINVYK